MIVGPRRATVLATLAMSFVLATTVLAKPHKVIVLPLDGNADTALRTKLSTSVQKLARVLDGQVSPGDTTFAETAAAVGCDPSQPKCVDEVLATLSVDEIVWGTATTANGQTTLVLHRASTGTAPRDLTTTIRPQDSQDKASASLLPLFQESTDVPQGSGSATNIGSDLGTTVTETGSGTGEALAISNEPAFDSHDRNVGIGLSVGGGIALVLGLALWSSAGSMQDRINAHSTQTADDINDLRQLEDSATKYAWGGNLMVVVGLAVGGYGAYTIYKDHQARMTATVAPVRPEQGTGATVTIGGTW
jgi:hypothetical protein